MQLKNPGKTRIFLVTHFNEIDKHVCIYKHDLIPHKKYFDNKKIIKLQHNGEGIKKILNEI